MKALFRAVVCSIFAAFLFLVIPITAEAMENTPAFIISGDIININGNDTIKTYGGHTYWLTKEQMETIVSGRDTTPIFNKNFWSNGSLFSSYEKHGSPTWRYHKADGIYLNDLLMAIGVNDKDIANLNSVRFHGSDKYITQMDYYGLLKRYYYSNKTIKANEGKEVYPKKRSLRD